MNAKNILIPIDFSDEAMHGLASGLKIARDIDAKITLFHALPKAEADNFSPSADIQLRQEEAKENDHYMAELIARKKSDLDKIIRKYGNEQNQITGVIRIGDFEDTLKDYLNDHKADLIVMGTSGETSFWEWFSGNHAAVTMRIADVPVLIVKEETWIKKNGHLMLLTDMKAYKEENVTSIRDFAELMNMKVHLTHILQNKDATVENIQGLLEDFAKDYEFKNYTIEIISKGDLSQMVKSYVQKHDMDIIASISEGNSGLIRLFFGSNTEKMINELDLPYLAVSE
ncbi:universal stress protein [Hyphobacterium sp. CCMP332]|nr:universal stress protein [Hyphobacterium sp. CCMP332]